MRSGSGALSTRGTSLGGYLTRLCEDIRVVAVAGPTVAQLEVFLSSDYL